MTARTGWFLAGAFTLMSATVPRRAAASADPRYVIAVGYNGAPPAQEATGNQLPPLRFADDDAAQVYGLFADVGRGFLLSSFDAETARRYPELLSIARPPTLSEVRLAVADIAQRTARDRAAGAMPAVTVFYSGHGASFPAGPALALADGIITSSLLYEEVIAPLAANHVHVIVDACHAESVVRPRDLQATLVEVTPADADAYLQKVTLARFPTVGAIIATTGDAEAHEWNTYGSGVFTHELVSGLRGGADVDGDGRVEYSEMSAFLAAANRQVTDPRARLDSVVRAPPADPRAPLIDLGQAVKAARLRGHLARLGPFFVEDDRGVRLLDLQAERGFLVTLVVPGGRTLYIRSRDGEREVTVAPGRVASLDDIAVHPAALVARGSIAAALRRGLFGTAFGPGYYLGYVDRVPGAPAVTVGSPSADDDPSVRAVPPRSASWRQRAGWVSLGVAGALAAGAVALGAAAGASYEDVEQARTQRDAVSARDDFVSRRNLGLGLAGAAALVGATGWWLWKAETEPKPGGPGLIFGWSGGSATVSGRF